MMLNTAPTGATSASAAAVPSSTPLRTQQQKHRRAVVARRAADAASPTPATAAAAAPLLLRAARGEAVERTPVWLMRQAGRYMAAFREYSDKYAFRVRSETPEIAIELSLQPWRAFRPDGVIFFSDILTPLPAMGIEFDVVKGQGPRIADPVRDAARVAALRPLASPADQGLAFTGATLSALRGELAGTGATLLGFVGTPWTLAAYSVEGKADKECRQTKLMMAHAPATLHALLERLTESIIQYASYQVASGAQAVQLFDSWAHHLSPSQFAEFSLPYANRVAEALKARHPDVPVIFHANGGAGKLGLLGGGGCSADVVGLDWSVGMAAARRELGGGTMVVQGNVDPMLLFAPEDKLVAETEACLLAAGPRGHILNVGHGVPQGAPERGVAAFCEAARASGELFARHGVAVPAAGGAAAAAEREPVAA
jgi:uroporphyrinogen decarboxylase